MFPLVLQSLLAIVALRELHRHVMPALASMRQPEVVIDAWAPLAIVIPLLFMTRGAGAAVESGGWIALGGPVACGWIGLAAAMLAGDAGGDARGLPLARHRRREPMIWAVVGLVLLLLGAAHVMTLWVGQCAFAAAAVLMWLNTPDALPHDEARDAEPRVVRGGFGMMIVLAAAIGQGVMARMTIDGPFAPIAGGLILGYAATALAIAVIAGGDVAARIGGWTAAYGVLIALGLLSLDRMLPAALGALLGQPVLVDRSIATGFGAYAPEAVALIILAGAVPLAGALPPRAQRIIGALALLGVATWAAARIS